jgi:hypothetical protein
MLSTRKPGTPAFIRWKAAAERREIEKAENDLNSIQTLHFCNAASTA